MVNSDGEGFLGKLLEQEDFYWDDRGFRVFTEKYLLKRGFCCKNYCKHCPYGIRNEHSKLDTPKI